MKRAPSEDLFRLIRSLSKGEKRNFKLLAGLLASEKDKKYIELFDVIDKQEVYDEGKVVKLLKHLYGGQLAVGKHYLFKLILNSLVYYSSNPGSELSNLVEQVKVLISKDLYPQATKLIRKGIQQAEAIEDFAMQYVLLGLQLDLLMRLQNEKNMLSRIDAIEQARAALIAKMQNLDAYRALNHKAFALLQTRQVASAQVDRAALADLLRHPLVIDGSQAASTRATIEYYGLRRKFCSLANDLEGAIGFSSKLLSLYDDMPELKQEHIREYFSELGNVCTYLMRLGRVNAAFAKMEEIKHFRNAYPKSRVDFFQLYYVMLAAAAVHIGEPERAVLIEEEMEQEWAAMDGKVPKAHEMWLRYLMAYAHLMLGKPRGALRWINRLLAEPRSDLRLDIQANARLLNLLVHCELGNYMLIESEVLSARRFLERHDQYHDYEKQVLKAIKALAVAANGPQAESVKEMWRQRLAQFETNDSKQVPRMIDVSEWLDANLQGRTMAALRREKLDPQDLSRFHAELVAKK